MKPSKRCCSRRFRRRRGSIAPRSKAPPVSYNGPPEFKAIDGTSLQRAVNTDTDIIQVGAVFYYCNQGVWFTSKAASGPWQVATTIPAEIYKIPASSPSHHVTYVVVEEDDNDNDEWVTFAYVAGYTGLMIGWGCAVWGSGWYYPPYYYGGIYYPHFADLWILGPLQPVDRYVWPERGRVRTVRRHGRERALQPAIGNLLSRRRRMGTVRRERRGAGLQPADRRVRTDAARLECLRQLGIDIGSAR